MWLLGSQGQLRNIGKLEAPNCISYVTWIE